MIRKVLIGLGLGSVALVTVFAISSRGVWELTGFCQATADEAVDNLTGKLPAEIRDRKMQNELDTARRELTDRQVALNLSRRRVEQVRDEVSALEIGLAGRERLLAQAYPTLKSAVSRQQDQVRFANSVIALKDFQDEIDDLMTRQERETRQLKVKREALDRIEGSLKKGETALADLRGTLESVEEEVAALTTRREQAEVESTTLDLISSVTATEHSAASSVREHVDEMKAAVDALEARNNARRDFTPTADTSDGRVSRAWNRLETLKSYHDQLLADESGEPEDTTRTENTTDRPETTVPFDHESAEPSPSDRCPTAKRDRRPSGRKRREAVTGSN